MTRDEARKAYKISGRVQGVGFRWWVRQQALELSLRGTVYNHPDGSVRVEAEGDVTAMRQLHTLLQSGPLLARVDQVEELPPPTHPLPSDFRIRT
jgi:acylphosphatase